MNDAAPTPPSSPAMTLLRVVALASSIGIAGYLVVQAQRRANPEPEVVEGPGLPNDADPLMGDKGTSLPVDVNPFPAEVDPASDPFLYSSKTIQSPSLTPALGDLKIETPGGVEGEEESAASPDAVFLSTSKSAGDLSTGFFFDDGMDGSFKGDSTFLYSSKSAVFGGLTDEQQAAIDAGTEGPQPAAASTTESGGEPATEAPRTFLPSSKSLTITFPVEEQPRTDIKTEPAEDGAKAKGAGKTKGQTVKSGKDG